MTVAMMELLRITVTAFQEIKILQRTFVGFTTEGWDVKSLSRKSKCLYLRVVLTILHDQQFSIRDTSGTFLSNYRTQETPAPAFHSRGASIPLHPKRGGNRWLQRDRGLHITETGPGPATARRLDRPSPGHPSQTLRWHDRGPCRGCHFRAPYGRIPTWSQLRFRRPGLPSRSRAPTTTARTRGGRSRS